MEWFFEPFLACFFPQVHADIDWTREPEFLDKELQEIVPESASARGTVDKLVKVWTKDGVEAWVLIHVEVQSQRDADFSRRMYVYNHRLEDRYGRMPVSLAILGDESPAWRPTAFVAGRWGCEVSFSFPTVKLLDYTNRLEELESDANPFAAVIVAHLKALETRGEPTQRYDSKLRLIKSLYHRGLTRVQVQRLFHVIAWVMKLPRDLNRQLVSEVRAFEEEQQVPRLSPIEQMWQEDGIAVGLLQGRAEGLASGLRNGIRQVLKLRFGQPGVDLMPRVQLMTDTTELETLLESIELAPDLDAVRARLPQ